MALKITYVSGNFYHIHDAFLVAEADLYGGPGGGMTIILRSIRNAKSMGSRPDADTSEGALISHLEIGLKELNRFRSFVVAFNGMVVASTNPDAPKGSRIPTEIRYVPWA